MAREPFTIGNKKIAPGTRATEELPVARLYTDTALPLTVHVIHGQRPGPVMFVCAAVHGDEINGVEIIRRLLRRKSLLSLRGTLIAIPIVNSFGFIHNARYLPDRRDLNRVFPGSEMGSLAARVAGIFMREIGSRCSHGIDLHTGSNHHFNLPQIRAGLDDHETNRLAEAFGAPVVLNSRTRDGSLRESVAKRGIPVLVYEAGEALRFNEPAIRCGLRGILTVMRAIGMLAEKTVKRRHPVFHCSVSNWIRAPMSGILLKLLPVGSQVKKGERLCVIADPCGEAKTSIYAPFSGLIIGRLELPLVHQGDAICHLAILEGDPDASYLAKIFG
ncbi:MAG: succinylglutamate desuccinylase/aspartoacylase family protein [Desulforhopalus sp.]